MSLKEAKREQLRPQPHIATATEQSRPQKEPSIFPQRSVYHIIGSVYWVVREKNDGSLEASYSSYCYSCRLRTGMESIEGGCKPKNWSFLVRFGSARIGPISCCDFIKGQQADAKEILADIVNSDGALWHRRRTVRATEFGKLMQSRWEAGVFCLQQVRHAVLHLYYWHLAR